MGSENESYIFNRLGEVLGDAGNLLCWLGWVNSVGSSPVVLWFGFVLLTQGCFIYKCWAALPQLQGLFCPSGCPTIQGGPSGSWKRTKYRENSNQTTSLNVLSVSSKTGKMLLHTTGCLLYSSCSASQRTHHVSKPPATCNIFPKTLFIWVKKIFPAQFVALNSDQRVGAVWNTTDFSNKIMRFIFPFEEPWKGWACGQLWLWAALQEPAGGVAVLPSVVGKLQAGLCLPSWGPGGSTFPWS